MNTTIIIITDVGGIDIVIVIGVVLFRWTHISYINSSLSLSLSFSFRFRWRHNNPLSITYTICIDVLTIPGTI